MIVQHLSDIFLLHICNLVYLCALILSQVYDVTPFLDDHPGGDEILLMATGKFIRTRFTEFKACVLLTLLLH